jgi:hypothetical protein
MSFFYIAEVISRSSGGSHSTEKSGVRSWWSGLGSANQIAIVIPLVVAVGGGVLAIALAGGRNDPGVLVVKERNAAVLIDGLSLIDHPDGGEVIDLQIRNAGDRVAYLHSVSFRILAMSSIPFCPHPSAIRASYTYDVAFPDPTAPERMVLDRRIDQAVPGDGVDRFRLALGFPVETLASGLYQVQVSVAYNQDRRTSPELVVVNLDGFLEPAAYTIIGSEPSYLQCLREEVQSVLQIVELPGARSHSVDELRASILRLQWEIANSE